MNNFYNKYVSITLIFLLIFSLNLHATKQEIKIGFQRITDEQVDFTPLEKYLEQEIPNYNFRIIQYSPPNIIEALLWSEIEFAVCNPYVCYLVNLQKGCKVLATFSRLGPNNQPMKLKAGVIFCKASRDDINTLNDIKGKIIASPGRNYFAGWILPLYELYKNNLYPISKFATVLFTGSNGLTIDAVINGTADIGCIDAYILWKLTKEGKINQNEIKIINQKSFNPELPITHSTIASPEYSFISLNNVPEELQRKITLALIKIPVINPLTESLGFSGFSLPVDYSGTTEILKTIKYPPYEERVDLKTTIKTHWLLFTGFGLALIFLTSFIITIFYTIHQLKIRKEMLFLLSKSTEIQKQLESSERKFRTLAEQFPGAVFIVTPPPESSILFITNQIETLTGFSKEEFLSGKLSLLNLVHNEYRDYLLSEKEEKISSKEPYNVIYKMQIKDKKWIWVNEIGTGVWDDSKLLYIQGYILDITEVKEREEKEEKKLERTNIEKEILIDVMLRPEVAEGDFEGLSHFITETISTKLRIPRVNIWLFNEDETQLICVDHYDLSTGIHSKGVILKEEDFKDEFQALKTSKYVDAHDALNDPRTKGYAQNYLIPLNIKSMLDTGIRIGDRNRGVICLEYTQIPHKWEEDEISFASQIADQLALTLINKEKRSYEFQRNLLIQTIETSTNGMIIFDSNGLILYLNPAIFNLLNVLPEDYLNKPITYLTQKVLPIENLDQKRSEAGKGKIHKERLEIKRGEKNSVILDCSISSIHNIYENSTHFVIHLTDVTREVKLENDLRQMQKMESIGQLAGGIAHDLNNHLLVIQGYTELIESEIPKNSPLCTYLQEIRSANLKASTLVKQLLAFARKQLLKKESISLNETINDILNMIRRIIKENVKLETFLQPNLPNIYADKNAIEVIIINLCSNANDAMPEGGEIIIETNKTYLTKEKVEGIPNVKEGEFVVLTITDTGIGMDKNTLEHCFEPFFTTKAPGKGTGLGLSTVYGLVQQHDGIIHVYSEPGKGTSFKIYLPTTSIPQQEKKVEESEYPELTGSETILIAEDEPAVRAVSIRILERAGYNVISAENGEEALNLFMENIDKIDLVILDIIMPVMGGKEVYEKIKKLKPDTPVLFTSGYSENSIHTNFVIHEGYQILQKPYGRLEILKEVRKILDKKKQP